MCEPDKGPVTPGLKHTQSYVMNVFVGLFVDVGNNYSVLEYNNISFVYDDVDSRETVVTTDFTGELVLKYRVSSTKTWAF